MASGKFQNRSQKVKAVGDHDMTECNHYVNGKFIHYKPAKATEGKKMIKINETERTRELILPDRNPIDIPKILPKSEMMRLTNQGHVLTLEEKKSILEQAEQKQMKLAEESEKRKNALASHLKQVSKTTKLDFLQSEAKQKNLYTLQRSFELQQEQEEEVKRATSVILATKCKAIRDAQIAEKTLIAKELEEEEKRLDMMMEQKRQQAMKDEAMKKQREEEKRIKFVNGVKNQMQENEIMRLLEAEMIEEESKQLNKINIQIQREEAALLDKRQQQKHQMREDLRKVNEEMEHYKQVRAEEERIADLRIKEFMRKKLEREEAREEELKLQKLAKEREIARLKSVQQKSQDAQSIANEMNARRIQDEAERAWRQKELETAQKRKAAIEDLKNERSKQVENIRRAQALEMERDKQQFLELAKLQKEDFDREMKKIHDRKEAAYKHRKDLLKQVNIKERERIQEHKDKFEEGNAMRVEKEYRDKHIKDTIRHKIENLRNSHIPEKYIADVERQLKPML